MSPEIPSEEVQVSVDGASVMLQAPGAAACRLSPDMAEQLARRLVEAADQARGDRDADGRPKPPFPPAELVSPHAAG